MSTILDTQNVNLFSNETERFDCLNIKIFLTKTNNKGQVKSIKSTD